MRPSLTSNILKTYLLAGTQQAMFAVPVIVLFFLDHGLSLTQVFVLQSVFSAALLTLEIPSGYISDTWGRKRTLVVASFVATGGMVVYALSSSFSEFLVAELLLALATSLFSGTGEAIIYDTLLALGRPEQYRSIAGRMHAVMFGVEAIAGVLGGLLALISLRTTLWATAAIFAVGIPLALSLKEPDRHKPIEITPLRTMGRVMKHTFFHSHQLRAVVLLTGILSSLTLSLVWFTQPYLKAIEFTVSLFGVAHSMMLAGALVLSLSVPYLKHWISDRNLLLVITGFVLASFFGLAGTLSAWGIVLLFIGRATWGAIKPVSSDIVNKLTSSDIRATVLSVKAFTSRAIFALLGPLAGYAADAFSLNQSLLIIGAIGALVSAVLWVSLRSGMRALPV